MDPKFRHLIRLARGAEVWAGKDLYLLMASADRRTTVEWSLRFENAVIEIETTMTKIRGRSYDLGSGMELIPTSGFRAARRRLAVMRAAYTMGLKPPKAEDSEIQ